MQDADLLEWNEFLPELTPEQLWLIKRLGHFSGSKMSDLMKTSRKTAKNADWSDPEKIADFSDSKESKAYCFSRLMERLTKLSDQQISARQLEHGKDTEPLLIDQILKDGLILEYQKCDFKKSDNIDWFGATPDGLVRLANGDLAGLETKCCVSWSGFFDRRIPEVDVKHKDFWQFQSEMHVLGVDKLLYVVAMPMQHERYSNKIIEASEVHQNAMVQRVEMVNSAIDIVSGCDLESAIDLFFPALDSQIADWLDRQ